MSFFQNDGYKNLPGLVLGSGFYNRVCAASLFEPLLIVLEYTQLWSNIDIHLSHLFGNLNDGIQERKFLFMDLVNNRV